eukprot:6829741-Pyramimonas_sp.AAC.1
MMVNLSNTAGRMAGAMARDMLNEFNTRFILRGSRPTNAAHASDQCVGRSARDWTALWTALWTVLWTELWTVLRTTALRLTRVLVEKRRRTPPHANVKSPLV